MTTTNVTKIQREVLEAAARRNDYAAWPIRGGNLNIGSATRVMKELIRKGLAIETSAVPKAPVWREDGGGQPLMAIISADGLAAIGMAPPVSKKTRSTRAAGKKAPVATKQGAVAAVSPNEAPRPGSKLAMLVALLSREAGATLDELNQATGWQSHSTRGVMSGTLRKKFGLVILSEKVADRGRVYRLRS